MKEEEEKDVEVEENVGDDVEPEQEEAEFPECGPANRY
jgi:hypothetical protein